MSDIPSRAMQAAMRNAPPDRLKHYPADFTSCGCGVYNLGGVAVALVSRDGKDGRICETCGATWQGDRKRHKNLPLVEWRTGITGARGRRG
jgi:hypothetical protein